MNQDSKKIYLFLTSFSLSFFGILMLVFTFFNVLGGTNYYETGAMIIFTFIISALFCGIFVYVKKPGIAMLISVAAAAVFFLIFRKQILSGAALYINGIIDRVADYMGAELLYFELTRSSLRAASEPMAIYFTIGVITIVYAYAISRRELVVIPMILCVVMYIFPLIIEQYAPVGWLLFGIVYILQTSVLMVSSFNGLKKTINRLSVHIASLIVGAVIMICGIIAILIMPKDTYERPAYFDQVKDKTVDIVEQIQNGQLGDIDWNSLSPFSGNSSGNTLGGILDSSGGGSLGQADELKYSGKEVLKVILPNIGKRIYIRGFIGADYTATKWEQPSQSGFESVFDSMELSGYRSSQLTADYIELMGYGNDIDYLKGYMLIEPSINTGDFCFAPVYSHVNTGTGYKEAGYGSIDTAERIKFFYAEQNQLMQLDNYNYDLDNSLTMAESMYRDYVYKSYLNVNTTIASQLRSQWEDREISSGQDRYKVAAEIRDYLGKKCSYTVKPGKVPEGKDFVEYFLNETQKGYCTYFATTAVMMLRSAGIPARYVEGYAFDSRYNNTAANPYSYTEYVNGNEIEHSEGDYITCSVKDSSAHAWVEFYIDGVGWVDYEVTPGNYEPDEAQTTVETTSEPEQQTTTEPASVNETTTEVTKPATETSTAALNDAATEPDNQEGQGFHFEVPQKLLKILKIIGIVIGVIAAVIAFIIIRYKIVAKKMERMYNNMDFGKANISIIRDYMSMEHIFDTVGFARRPEMMYEEYAEYLKENNCPYIVYEDAVQITGLYEKAVFSDDKITPEDVKEADRIYRLTREILFRDTNVFQKIRYVYFKNI